MPNDVASRKCWIVRRNMSGYDPTTGDQQMAKRRTTQGGSGGASESSIPPTRLRDGHGIQSCTRTLRSTKVREVWVRSPAIRDERTQRL